MEEPENPVHRLELRSQFERIVAVRLWLIPFDGREAFTSR